MAMSRARRPARHDAGIRFRDRRDAGRVLGGWLTSYCDRDAVLVLGLARGGVPVAREVAAALRAPLDVFLVRKLGVPRWPELAMGALATGGGMVLNRALLRSQDITEEQLQQTIDRESAELRRREAAYRGDRPAPELTARTVILVDDGIATGASMLAAVRAVRATSAKAVVVAVPVGAESACREVAAEADDLVCVSIPPDFSAVGQAYDDFSQTTDDEVRSLLTGQA